MSREAQIFFPEFNISFYDKNSESDYFFFLHQNQNIFLEKNHNPPFKLNGRSLSTEKFEFFENVNLEYCDASALIDWWRAVNDFLWRVSTMNDNN